MNLKRRLSGLPLLRPLALRVLRLVARDISIGNPWTGDNLYLNSFRHKGYWYFGKDREARTMERLAKIVRPGEVVFEVGGHIGYLSQYFSKLVGQSGRLVVFEPGTNNLPYLQRNIELKPNVQIERTAVSDHEGEAIFYQDDITGQNNSLLPDYRGADGVGKSHSMTLNRHEVKVRLVTLDGFVGLNAIQPDFIKMDIEGHELGALRGAINTLNKVRGLMVEVTENQHEVGELLLAAGFSLSDEAGRPLVGLDGFSGNVFALRK